MDVPEVGWGMWTGLILMKVGIGGICKFCIELPGCIQCRDGS